MTNIEVYESKNVIHSFKLSGHAFYAEYGNDIVCSAISMLCYTIANKLLDIEGNNVKVDIKEGSFELSLNKITKENQLLLQTLKMGFLMLEEQYGEFVKLKEVDYV